MSERQSRSTDGRGLVESHAAARQAAARRDAAMQEVLRYERMASEKGYSSIVAALEAAPVVCRTTS